MRQIRAADVVKHRLGIAARRLGTADPSGAIGRLLDDSFPLPLGDRRYGRNLLTPGYMPLEHSFSESSGGCLRLDMEPLGPDVTAATRQNETSRVMRQLVKGHYGDAALRWFDERSEPFRGSVVNGDRRFGAWFGAAFDDGGMREAKVYYELNDGELETLPPNLRHAARVAMAALPGLAPLGLSIACGRNTGAQRLYFVHRGDLRLLDLEPLMNTLGVGHQVPGMLTALGLMLGGRFTLPRGTAIIGLRDTSRGMELSLYVLMPGFPDPPKELHGLIQMLLQQRPEAQRSLRHWMQAMTPDEFASPGDISTVMVRVTPSTPARLSVYFLPVGYDQPPSRDGNGERREASPDRVEPLADPYALSPA